jgi:hypothetical protein
LAHFDSTSVLSLTLRTSVSGNRTHSSSGVALWAVSDVLESLAVGLLFSRVHNRLALAANIASSILLAHPKCNEAQ